MRGPGVLGGESSGGHGPALTATHLVPVLGVAPMAILCGTQRRAGVTTRLRRRRLRTRRPRAQPQGGQEVSGNCGDARPRVRRRRDPEEGRGAPAKIRAWVTVTSDGLAMRGPAPLTWCHRASPRPPGGMGGMHAGGGAEVKSVLKDPTFASSRGLSADVAKRLYLLGRSPPESRVVCLSADNEPRASYN